MVLEHQGEHESQLAAIGSIASKKCFGFFREGGARPSTEVRAVPSALLNQIKRVAAFQNPEFYKKQMMRMSTAGTPRVIACAEEFPEHVAVPRGCHQEIEDMLRDRGITLVVKDERHPGARLRLRFHGELSTVQKRAAETLLRHDVGVFVAPPGLGKTVLATNLLAERGRSTLILVHRSPLLDQWVTHLSMFLGIDETKIGRIGGWKRRDNWNLDVAMLQSLVRRIGDSTRVPARIASSRGRPVSGDYDNFRG